MAFLFGRNRSKTNAQLCRSTKELLLRVNAEDQPSTRLQEELSRDLQQMKGTLQGTPEQDPSPQQVHQLIEYLTSEDVLYPLALSIHKLPFESRKDAQAIFSNVFRFRPGSPAANGPNEPLVLQHIVNQRPEIMVALCNGYQHRESAMPCGGILKEALKHDSMTALILYDEPGPDGLTRGLRGVDPNEPASGNGVFWKFFDWIDKGHFEVSADAFNTFTEILTKHKKLLSHFLLTNYNLFTQTYNKKLMMSPSYVTKRVSIKLLGEVMLDRANFTFMTTYVESGDNLKLVMNILRDERRMITYEAFHIFKIFVANPNKSYEVQKILIMNRARLLKFLPAFMDDRKDDLQFNDEKAYLVKQIEDLPAAPTASGQSAAGVSSGPGSGGSGAVVA